MSRVPTSGNPESELAKLVKRVERLENQNRLNNAEVSGTIRFHGESAILLEGSAQVSAGDYTLVNDDFVVPWGQSSHLSLRTVLDAIDGRARSAGDRADEAWTRAGNALTSAGNAHNRADNAYSLAQQALDAAGGNASQSQLTALASRVTALESTVATHHARIIALHEWAIQAGQVNGIPFYPLGSG